LYRLADIYTDYDGFQELIRLHEYVSYCIFPGLHIDTSFLQWLDANMCAPLGAVLYEFARHGRIAIELKKPGLKSILERNGFLHNFGFTVPKGADRYGTTIEYQRFDCGDAEAFKAYVAQHFVGKGIPNMSEALHRKFRESISEVFDNAVEHSGTEAGIFACGQYFPKKQQLDFCIADLGIGMRSVLERRGIQLSAEQAIEWAMSGDNTTRLRSEGRPGGLGLKLIRDFVRLNGGSILIVSDAGYWRFHGGNVELRTFPRPFPGTVVNIEINTADTQSYCLASEVDPKSIF
jgi:anti-sigma regulatory factor (Ser/Thr protein kinase)